MTNSRHLIEMGLLSALCKLTSPQSAPSGSGTLHRTRILSGLLRGMYFSMPQLERLSFALGTYESHMVSCMQRHLQSGSTVYDIGANAGYFTLVLSKLTGASGSVFAFEPDPKNIAMLSHNIQDNKVGNATIVKKAVSDTQGELTFATFGYSLVGHIAHSQTPSDATLLQVPSTTLDHFVYGEGNPAPQFIKIDVEGAEDRVIFGADRVLREARPIVLAEVREGEIHQKISAFLTERNYRIERLKGGWDADKHQLSDLLLLPNP